MPDALPPPGPARITYVIDPATGLKVAAHALPVPGMPGGPVRVPISELAAYKERYGLETAGVIPMLNAETAVVVRKKGK